MIDTVNFTPRAQQVLALARKEAERLQHASVAPVHLLLGILKLGEGMAYDVLRRCELDLEKLRAEVEVVGGAGIQTAVDWQRFYSAETKKVIALAGKEQKELGHIYLGSEHLLLGILAEGENNVCAILQKLGVNIADARAKVLALLEPDTGKKKCANADGSEGGVTDEMYERVATSVRRVLKTSFDVAAVSFNDTRAQCLFENLSSVPANVAAHEITVSPRIAAVLIAVGEQPLSPRLAEDVFLNVLLDFRRGILK